MRGEGALVGPAIALRLADLLPCNRSGTTMVLADQILLVRWIDALLATP